MKKLTYTEKRLMLDLLGGMTNGFVDIKLMLKRDITVSNDYSQMDWDHENIKENIKTLYNAQ